MNHRRKYWRQGINPVLHHEGARFRIGGVDFVVTDPGYGSCEIERITLKHRWRHLTTDHYLPGFPVKWGKVVAAVSVAGFLIPLIILIAASAIYGALS